MKFIDQVKDHFRQQLKSIHKQAEQLNEQEREEFDEWFWKIRPFVEIDFDIERVE